MNTHLLFKIAEQEVVVFDGAMGTMLMNAGLPAGGPPELWNTEKPEVIQAIHRAYYAAGSHVVHTNTFGANAVKLGEYGQAGSMARLNQAAVEIARKACPAGRLVAGDMGPSGKMLKPAGDAAADDLEDAFFRQAGVLIAAGVDLISIETMFSLEEALCAVRGAKRAGSCPVIGATTYNRTPRGFFTIMGEDVKTCAAALEKAGVDVVGTNCSMGSHDMIDLTAELRSATRLPILVQPNAGSPVADESGVRYEQTPVAFGRDAAAIKAAGADMIGGCCGTDADFIRALKTAVA